jgi:hypothetical protein
MINNYMVAVCDILGFSKLVKDYPADVVVKDILSWVRKALYHSTHKNNFPQHVPTLKELQTHAHLGLVWFSDTIMLYTNEDNDESIRTLITTLSWLLFETIFNPYARLRCGVSYGQAVIEPENAIYVGKPFVEAFELEKSQAWSGGALTSKAVQRIPEEAREGQNINWWVVPYKVPLKEDKHLQTLAIDWTWGIHKQRDFLHWSKTSENPKKSDWETNPDICEKFVNTKNFHDAVCVFCGKRTHANVI